jgi:hypothetical protein
MNVQSRLYQVAFSILLCIIVDVHPPKGGLVIRCEDV